MCIVHALSLLDLTGSGDTQKHIQIDPPMDDHVANTMGSSLLDTTPVLEVAGKQVHSFWYTA